MGAAGAGAAVGVTAAGSVWSALAADAAGTYNNAMAQYDAKQLDGLAKDAIARGESEAQRLAIEGKKIVGEQRASAAGQGIDVSVGTAADLQLESLQLTERDLRTIRINAMEEARGIRTQAASTRANGRMGARAATGQAVGSLLTGGAQAISMATQGYDSYQSSHPTAPAKK